MRRFRELGYNIPYRVKSSVHCVPLMFYAIIYIYFIYDKKVKRLNIIKIFAVDDLRGIWCVVNVSIYLVRYCFK